MFTNEHTLEDNHSIAYDGTMPPVFDNYYKEYYDIGYNYNHPQEACHSYGGITQHHPSNMQLVYHVQVLYDDPTPIIINKKNFASVENFDTFMHMDHDKNVSYDGYIVDFINDATGIYYERGRHGFIYLNNIKSPLFLLKIFKFHLFCLSMLIASCFNNLFSYSIPLHRKWVRLKCVGYFLFDALLYLTLIHMRASLKLSSLAKRH